MMFDIDMKFYVVPTWPDVSYWSVVLCCFMLYLLGLMIDIGLTLNVVPSWTDVGYWSEVLCCTCMA